LIKKEDGKIDWNKSAEEIERQVRAFNPWPGAYALWDGKMLKIKKTEVHDASEVNKIGGVYEVDGAIRVNCGQGNLELIELQLEGKKSLLAKEFINGHPKIIGSILV
jgi:methionyl-tRNA formyltransferase